MKSHKLLLFFFLQLCLNYKFLNNELIRSINWHSTMWSSCLLLLHRSICLYKDKEVRILFNFQDRHKVHEDIIGVRSQSHSVHHKKYYSLLKSWNSRNSRKKAGFLMKIYRKNRCFWILQFLVFQYFFVYAYFNLLTNKN